MARNREEEMKGRYFRDPTRNGARKFTIAGRGSVRIQKPAEALEWVRSMQAELDKGYDFKGSTTTLNDYLPSWLENRKLSLRPKTAHQYGAIIKKHILPEIGDKKLKDLRLIQIEQFYSSLLQNGLGPRRSGWFTTFSMLRWIKQ